MTLYFESDDVSYTESDVCNNNYSSRQEVHNCCKSHEYTVTRSNMDMTI